VYVAVVEWVQGKRGRARGVSSRLVIGGGDSAGGNMTAAVSLRMRDEGMKPLAARVLIYPETILPFDTDAAAENNSGLYLECKSFSHQPNIILIHYQATVSSDLQVTISLVEFRPLIPTSRLECNQINI
jgi:acetyl esterase/lipase